MGEHEVRNMVADEVRRHLSPKTIYVLVSLVVGLLIWVMVLELRTQTQDVFIMSLKADVHAMKVNGKLATTMDELAGEIKAMREQLGATDPQSGEEPKGGTN